MSRWGRPQGLSRIYQHSGVSRGTQQARQREEKREEERKWEEKRRKKRKKEEKQKNLSTAQLNIVKVLG